MRFARRLEKIQPSMTLAINNRSQKLKAAGLPVISLAAGEPDFTTPQFIKEAAIKAIEDNFTRYTAVAGIPELRKAAGHYFERYYQTSVPPESIIIGAGGKQCIYTFMQTLLNPGDEVLIPSPYWVSYPDMALLADAVPVFAAAGPESGYKVTPAMLEKKATSKTRLLILNTPNNPTGAVYSEGEIADIIHWAMERGIFTLSDEIYDQLVFPPAKSASAISLFRQFPEYVGVVNGLSKSFAMTGWRVGFLAGAPELVKKMTVIQGHCLSNVCSIAQKAALAALTGPDACVAEMRDAFKRRRDMAMRIIKTWVKAVCPQPNGAFYLFVDIHGYYNKEISNSISFSSWLLEKANVGVVPGASFGDDNCIRMSYAISDASLKEALERIGKALESLDG